MAAPATLRLAMRAGVMQRWNCRVGGAFRADRSRLTHVSSYSHSWDYSEYGWIWRRHQKVFYFRLDILGSLWFSYGDAVETRVIFLKLG